MVRFSFALASIVLLAMPVLAEERETAEAKQALPESAAPAAEEARVGTPSATSRSRAEKEDAQLGPAAIAKLRRDCYGGRKKAASPLAREFRLHQAQQALQSRDPVRARDSWRRLLQGGAEEANAVPGLIKALEATGQAGDGQAASSCAELLHSLPRARSKDR